MIRTITSEDLGDCARLFAKVFSEWPYEESWSVTQAHHYLSRFWTFDPDHCLLVLEKGDVWTSPSYNTAVFAAVE